MNLQITNEEATALLLKAIENTFKRKIVNYNIQFICCNVNIEVEE